MSYKLSLALDSLSNMETQHTELALMLSKLKSLSQYRNNGQYIIQLNYLVAYSSAHFETEEEAMQNFEYAKCEEHKQQHSEFISLASQISTDTIEDKLTDFTQATQFLDQWVEEHNLSYDAEFELFLSNIAG